MMLSLESPWLATAPQLVGQWVASHDSPQRRQGRGGGGPSWCDVGGCSPAGGETPVWRMTTSGRCWTWRRSPCRARHSQSHHRARQLTVAVTPLRQLRSCPVPRGRRSGRGSAGPSTSTLRRRKQEPFRTHDQCAAATTAFPTRARRRPYRRAQTAQRARCCRKSAVLRYSVTGEVRP